MMIVFLKETEEFGRVLIKMEILFSSKTLRSDIFSANYIKKFSSCMISEDRG